MLYMIEITMLIFLIIGAVIGWRRGLITSLVSFIFTILIFVGAFFLKNFVSVLMYENLPFFKFSGEYEGVSALNILIYEAIAFVICLIALVLIAFIITKLTNLVNKLVNATVILALPNKIFGMILSLTQFFIIMYFVLFILVQIPYTNKMFGLNESNVATVVINKTPGLSLMTDKYYESYKEVYDAIELGNATSEVDKDYLILDILMKNKIVTVESVQKLKDQGKLDIENIDELINKYNK